MCFFLCHCFCIFLISCLASVHRNKIGEWLHLRRSWLKLIIKMLKLSHNQELAKCQSQLQMRNSASTIRITRNSSSTILRIKRNKSSTIKTAICALGIYWSQPSTWKRNSVESLRYQEKIKKIMNTIEGSRYWASISQFHESRIFPFRRSDPFLSSW